MSYSKENKSSKTGLAFCRASGTFGATKHHLNLQERHIQRTADKENVHLKRVVKLHNQRVSLPLLMLFAEEVDVLYITSPDRLTRSTKAFASMVSKLENTGIEVRVTVDEQESIFDDILSYMFEERMYWVHRNQQERAQKHKDNTC